MKPVCTCSRVTGSATLPLILCVEVGLTGANVSASPAARPPRLPAPGHCCRSSRRARVGGTSGSGHTQRAWHWVLLVLKLVAFMALHAYAGMTLRQRAALATTTHNNQAFVGPNRAPAGAASAGASAV